MNEAILIQSEEWEGLFVGGKCVEEGETLNEGTNRILYFNELAKKYSFDIKSLKYGYVVAAYQEKLFENGSFDKDLTDVSFVPTKASVF